MPSKAVGSRRRDRMGPCKSKKLCALLLMGLAIGALGNGSPAHAIGFPGASGKIAFDTGPGTGGGICTMNGDGSGRGELPSNSPIDQQPSFSSDGTKIAFVTTRDGG